MQKEQLTLQDNPKNISDNFEGMIKFDNKTEDILTSLEATQHEFWNLDRFSAQFLYSLIKLKNAQNVLEIGTSNGYSGIWILKALEDTDGCFTTIEFWEKRQSVARKNFNLCTHKKYEAKIGDALIVLEDLAQEIKANVRKPYDFIFIDANKNEYVQYLKLLDEMMSAHAVILADNILTHKAKTQSYVDSLVSRKDFTSQILNIGAGMMLSVRNNKKEL